MIEKLGTALFAITMLLWCGSSAANIYAYMQTHGDVLILNFKQEPSLSSAQLKNTEYLGRCNDAALLTGVDVYHADDLGDPRIEGMFYNDRNVIVFKDLDISTIAHEVSHFVDRTIQAKGIHDGETRAYLQGYFTECVYRLVSEYGTQL